LEKNLLIFVEVVIRINLGIDEEITILLEISNLIVETDELLSLLFDKERSLSYSKVHQSFLIVVEIFKLFHLIFRSLDAMLSLLVELFLVI
jgi:hypothetical protein